MTDDDTYSEFSTAVNMTAKQIEGWLDTDESKEVGQKKSGSGESTGHEMGRRIVTLLNTKKGDLTEDDYSGMRKVVGYVKWHMSQQPHGDDTHTLWRYSLMNWGHDPNK